MGQSASTQLFLKKRRTSLSSPMQRRSKNALRSLSRRNHVQSLCPFAACLVCVDVGLRYREHRAECHYDRLEGSKGRQELEHREWTGTWFHHGHRGKYSGPST